MSIYPDAIDRLAEKAREIADPLNQAGSGTLILESFVRVAALSRELGFDLGLPNARFHVAPTEDGWAVCTQDPGDAPLRYGSKRAAIDKARDMARGTAGILVIHREDGEIQSTYHYTLTS